ncbi:MerR family transcriptional regulator [Streptomyces chrestomyceticus JCM 4735]|uniref:MerR family transcriptional regulator n=1 Tax=Streptomyces chrestomyceticus JCM 4735 TaxID=1306181 RepID=A0A7U9KVP3_9ACTN|nr:MerR family transcriptional regulator [Streptomyces chrestomyceticus]GCD36270.1 MerR family transcriptional regulator [Streptomyces chrestomyceticus JCM 4735]
MTDQSPPPAEYRIEDLAHISGTSVRTIRAYQDRGLLPKPERRGRANVYGDEHLERLRRTADLLDRGYTLASIKELLEAWDTGRGLGGVLGLVAEIDGPWSDEEAARITREELDAAFGGSPDEEALADAVELGVLERLPGSGDVFRVPSPRELAVAAELHSAGVPLTAISGHLRELRGQVEHIAARFLDFTTEYVFHPYLDHQPTEAEATEAAGLVRRLRPLAQQTVDAELARAMRTLATRYIHHHLGDISNVSSGGSGDSSGSSGGSSELSGPRAGQDAAPEPARSPNPHPTSADTGTSAPEADPAPAADAYTDADADATMIALPADAVRAVRDLVGQENVAAFITAAARREVHARTMDELAVRRTPPH